MQETTLHPGGQFLAWWALPSLGGVPGTHLSRRSSACLLRAARAGALLSWTRPRPRARLRLSVELNSQDPALTTATSSLLGPLLI